VSYTFRQGSSLEQLSAARVDFQLTWRFNFLVTADVTATVKTKCYVAVDLLNKKKIHLQNLDVFFYLLLFKISCYICMVLLGVTFEKA
jgi:hypothetical protein